MMQIKHDEELMKLAEKRVKRKKEFHAHALTYVLVNGFLFMIYGMTSGFVAGTVVSGFAWPVIVAGGWGIGLAIHGLEAYTSFFGGKPTQLEIQREYAKLSGESRIIDYTDAVDTTDTPRHN